MNAFITASSSRGRGFCFGFVRFKDNKITIKAAELMTGGSFGGRRLVVNLAKFGWNQRSSSELKGYEAYPWDSEAFPDAQRFSGYNSVNVSHPGTSKGVNVWGQACTCCSLPIAG